MHTNKSKRREKEETWESGNESTGIGFIRNSVFKTLKYVAIGVLSLKDHTRKESELRAGNSRGKSRHVWEVTLTYFEFQC